MNQQQQIDFTGADLRDIGMKKATDNADSKTPEWSELAYKFLLSYISCHKEFMAEDVRKASEGIVPEPPSKRAWGSIFVKAAKNKLIVTNGTRPVNNPKAHRANAALWERI